LLQATITTTTTAATATLRHCGVAYRLRALFVSADTTANNMSDGTLDPTT